MPPGPPRLHGVCGLAGRVRSSGPPGSLARRQRVPNTKVIVAGARYEPRSIPTPGDGLNVVAVATQIGGFLASGQVDQADCAVGAGDRQAPAVRALLETVDDGPDRTTAISSRVRGSPNRIVLSPEPEITRSPSPLHKTRPTVLACPRRMASDAIAAWPRQGNSTPPFRSCRRASLFMLRMRQYPRPAVTKETGRRGSNDG